MKGKQNKYKTIINEAGDCEVLSIDEEIKRDKEEEDRILYVAMTRALHELNILYDNMCLASCR